MLVKVSDVLLPKSRIFLDVDGVLVDWASGCFKACGVDQAVGYARWAPGSFLITEALGMTEPEMWEHIEALGSEFWETLEWYPWAQDLYNHCLKIAPTYFITSPSNHWTSLKGKLDWMHKFTGDNKFRKYELGPNKELMAKPNNVLIDDYDQNVEKFAAEGGNTILFPQYWNKNIAYKDDPMPYVKDQIELWVQGQFERLAQPAIQAGKVPQ